MPILSVARLSLALLLSISPFSSEALAHTVQINATVPSNASKVVDRSFIGFAFEQSSFYNYSFDPQGNPNEFSQNLVDAVLSRTGGTSGDHGRYDAWQKNATNYPATKYGPQKKISGNRLAIEPSYFEASKNWPGANVDWARAGVNHIGVDNLYTMELGNELTFYPWFSIEAYAKRYQNLQARLVAGIPALVDKRIFQALDTASYAAGDLATKPAFQNGLNDTASSIKQVAYHYYQNQNGVANFVALQDYVRHTGTKANITKFLPDINYLKNNHLAIGFVFTETGYSVGGSGGKVDIETNNFASALWSLDFQLCAMSMGSSLQMWRPVKTSLGGPRVTAHFYSHPFVADFIGKSGKTRVVELEVGAPQNGLYAGYAAYDDGRLTRITLLNLQLWDSQRRSGDRPQAKFSLTGLKGTGSNITVHHLNADNGALAQTNVTYAGLEWTWASRGKQKKVKNDSKVLEINGNEVDIFVKTTQAVLLEIK
ncbi:hypothetical protein GGS24DRAFT_503494 [Hypoxylon argillaceum]|nr:hypothetical protein GGS24DRAFT_503494 [Hypoxylon argillaceum]